MDRRQAQALGITLPDQTTGAALLADLSGFTALTEALTDALGGQQGAEAITTVLNEVYEVLVAVVHTYRGSVVSFAGDAITVWFDGDDGLRAATCGLALQAAMAAAAARPLPDGGVVILRLKVVIATGLARRFLVGDPAIQLLDVLAGLALARLGSLEDVAAPGEVLLDTAAAATLAAAGPTGTWRPDPDGPGQLLALAALDRPAPPDPWPSLPTTPAGAADSDPAWILPAVRARLAPGNGTFLAELRPAVVLFLRFGGIDYTRSVAGARLDTYIRWVQQVLAGYDAALLGLVIGDKGSYLYAACGAPVAHADDAARAAAAALELRTPPPTCSMIRGVQIGINRGPVWAGAYGARIRRTYGVLGDAVNLAARLMQSAGPGSILATREVRQAAGGRFDWERLPALLVKGKAAPVPVYGLVAMHQAGDLGLPEPTYSTPLVGRAAELALLDDRLAATGSGQGQIVGLIAEAGLGKSRLVAEVVRRAVAAGFRAYGGAAQSYGTATAYLAWQSLWRAFFDLVADDPPDEQIAALEEALATIDPALSVRQPLLGPLLGLAIPDTALTAGLDASLRKASLEALLIDCLRARSAGGPMLLVLEDCHWLDQLSHDLLEAVGRAVAGLPVLILLAYRPPDIDRLQVPHVESLPHFTRLTLAPLDQAAAAEMILSHLGPGGLPDDLLAELTTRAGGNPFYLEELLAYLAERGVNIREPDALRDLDWPASLQSLLLARIDQLTEQQRTVLKVASIVGRRFQGLQICGAYPDLGSLVAIQPALGALDQAGLTPLELPAPSPVYLFKHIMTQEVTYAGLPQALRERLHGQFAAWLEAAGAAAGLPLPLDLLAYHYSKSQNQAKQHEYLRLAGDAAAAQYANAAAVEYYEQWLDLPPAGERGPVLLTLADVLDRMGRWEDAAARYAEAHSGAAAGDGATQAGALLGLGVVRRNQGAWAEAATWLQQADDAFVALASPLRGQVLIELAKLHDLRSASDEARELGAAALTHYRAAGDQAGMARALDSLATVAWHEGDNEAARTFAEASLDLRRALRDKPGMAQALNLLGTVIADQGEYPTAQALFDESIALHQEIGDKRGILNSLLSLGNLADDAGDYPVARTRYSECLTLAQELGDKLAIARALNNLALCDIAREDFAAAQSYLQASLALRRELGDKRGIALVLGNLGETYARMGDPATARALTEESLALSREVGSKAGAANSLHNLALLALAAGDTTLARDLWLEALALFRDLGAQADIPYGLVGLAGVAAAQGRSARAARLLTAAAQLLAALGSGDLQPVEQAVYDHAAATARHALGPAGFAAAQAAGAALSVSAALDYALADEEN